MERIDENKTYGVFNTTDGRILEAQIESSGAAIITIPVLETESRVLENGHRKCLDDLSSFDWIIFPDIFSARYFIEILSELRGDLSSLDELRITALGENVVLYLRSFHIHTDLLIEQRDIQNAVPIIEEFAGVKLRSLRFLFPSGPAWPKSLADDIRSHGAHCQELELYRTIAGDESDNARIKGLLVGGAIDEIVFSSTDDLLSLQYLLPENGVHELLAGIGITAANAEIFESLRDYGLQPRMLKSKDLL